ncbi:hypothetical protein C8J56DRAFT_926548 [Mycena floridula]|nr:hypothetical protein C8J56DRAFT_926548 [Mycena floridula]
MASLNKITVERNQKILLDLVSQPGNDTCADCKARGPRWASYNLGVFICVNCASIHRKIGTHISKVKSLTMDQWTKEQTEHMKKVGNRASNVFFNPNETRHPPPTNLMDAERDSELEQYIRAKYEYKRFLNKSPPVATANPARSATTSTTQRSQSTPLAPPAQQPRSTPSPRPTTSTLAPAPSPNVRPTTPQMAPSRSMTMPTQNQSQSRPAPGPQQGVWADLVSLQSGSSGPSLPLQYQAQQSQFMGNQSGLSNLSILSPSPGYANPSPVMGMSQSPFQMQQFGGSSQLSYNTAFPSSPFTPSYQQQQPVQSQYLLPQQSYAPSPISPSPMMYQQQQQIVAPQAQFGGEFLSTTPQPMSTTPQLQGQFLSPSPQFNGGGNYMMGQQNYPQGGWQQQQQQQQGPVWGSM